MLIEFQVTFCDRDGDNYYRLMPVTVDGMPKLWIQHKDGEGGSFEPELIYNLIHEYFREHF